MLHGATVLATCLATLEKEIHHKLQRTCHTLQSRTVSCNGFEKVHAIVAENRTALYFVQSLQVQKRCETSCKEGILRAATHLHLASQRHCNTSYKENCTV